MNKEGMDRGKDAQGWVNPGMVTESADLQLRLGQVREGRRFILERWLTQDQPPQTLNTIPREEGVIVGNVVEPASPGAALGAPSLAPPGAIHEVPRKESNNHPQKKKADTETTKGNYDQQNLETPGCWNELEEQLQKISETK